MSIEQDNSEKNKIVNQEIISEISENYSKLESKKNILQYLKMLEKYIEESEDIEKELFNNSMDLYYLEEEGGMHHLNKTNLFIKFIR